MASGQREGDVGELFRRRLDAAEGTRRRQQMLGVGRLGEHADALAFDGVAEAAQDRVVAAAGEGGEEGGAALVETDQIRACEEILLRDVARDHGLARTGFAQRAEERAEFTEPNPSDRVDFGLECGVGKAVERGRRDPTSGSTRAARHLEGQPPCPGDEPHRRGGRAGHANGRRPVRTSR